MVFKTDIFLAWFNVELKDYIYRMVKVQVQQYLTKPNHCIWPIRTHYTFVSTNEQSAPNEDDLAMVQRPSTITILYIWSLPYKQDIKLKTNQVSPIETILSLSRSSLLSIAFHSHNLSSLLTTFTNFQIGKLKCL